MNEVAQGCDRSYGNAISASRQRKQSTRRWDSTLRGRIPGSFKEAVGVNKTTFHIDALGSGSDYSPFIQHIGIPSFDLSFGGEDHGGDYHSIYDSHDDYRRFKDPGFHYGVALAQTAGRAVLRMAGCPSSHLPFG